MEHDTPRPDQKFFLMLKKYLYIILVFKKVKRKFVSWVIDTIKFLYNKKIDNK